MTTMTFKSTDLTLTEALETEVHAVGKDWISFENDPDKKIKMEATTLKDLNLKAGNKVKIEPITNSFTLTTLEAPVAALPPRKAGSSPVMTNRLRSDISDLDNLCGRLTGR